MTAGRAPVPDRPTGSAPVVVLSGGVGGAKLVLGLSRVVDPAALTVVANTGDDFDHLGLRVCPDVDTLVYALAGLDDPATGWGRAGESGNFMEAVGALGEDTWFFLGDKDLAMHVARTRRLAAGERLGAVTGGVCRRLGVAARILPMSDDPVSTVVETGEGRLPFQHYFVRDRCRPAVRGFRYDGAETAAPGAGVMEALAAEGLRAAIVAPSNPFVSIDPILAVPGVREALRACRAPVVAVTPIVGRRAIKGPTAKMMRELGVEVSPVAVARRYRDFADGFVLDASDAELAPRVTASGLRALTVNTVMDSLDDRTMLARDVLEFCDQLSGPAAGRRASR